MILAAVGLLQGYQATCHWAFCDQLAMLGVEVIPQRLELGQPLLESFLAQTKETAWQLSSDKGYRRLT